MAHFKCSQASQRLRSYLVATLAMALFATLVPRPRIQWMLQRYNYSLNMLLEAVHATIVL